MISASFNPQEFRSPNVTRTRLARLAVLTVAAALLASVASGCGGKPQYCADRDALQTSVKALPNAATSGGVSALQAQLTTVQADAKVLEASAKADFPTEANAVDSAITQLSDSIKALPEKPSTTQQAALAINVSAVVNSVQAFNAATDKDCIEE